MSCYDDIYEYAADNYGLITSAEARGIGIPNVELAKLAYRGRLVHVGHGVYRVRHYIPTPLDAFADALALVGDGAYVFGESVLAMHNLALVNPVSVKVALNRKLRKQLPKGVVCIVRKEHDKITHYEGLPTQSVFDAILTCKASVMSERLIDAAEEAFRQGLITEQEADIARKEIGNAYTSAQQ